MSPLDKTVLVVEDNASSDLGHLTEGQKVSFAVEQGERGSKAVNLQEA